MTGDSAFGDLEHFVAIPRVTTAALSPDGRRLVCSVSTLSTDVTTWVSSLWEMDPTGHRPAHRLTRSAKGEGSPAFVPNGDVLFVSGRPDPQAKESADTTSLWLLPADGGEARPVLDRKGGVEAVLTARSSMTIVVVADVLGGPLAGDDDRRRARKEAGTDAILHEQALVRFWDHDLGPGEPRLLATESPVDEERCREPHDLMPDGGRGLYEGAATLTPDGTEVITSWFLPDGVGYGRWELAALSTVTGQRRVVCSSPSFDFTDPRVAPDASWIACKRSSQPSLVEPSDTRPWLVRPDGTQGHDPCPQFDRWPEELAWAPDSTALFVVADDLGHAPIFRVELDSGEVTKLTASGAHSSLQPAPDASAIYCVRSTVAEAPHVVRYDTRAPTQQPVVLPGPRGAAPEVAGRLEEVHARSADGTPLRAWLVLPPADEPIDTSSSVDEPGTRAPLMVWAHGGPIGSWNAWHWRWNPWVAAARGYAVLLPDPAFSTGYGLEMIRRGWGQWGGNPFTDVLALTDVAMEHPAVDAERLSLLGGSYGGYLANWTATHDDRFRCIVTHASLWAMEQFAPTTDAPGAWRREWGDPVSTPERYERWSPHRYADDIRTPMLVIHGDKDYRVPIGEALRLWDDVTRRGVDAKFLVFPSEGHWIQTPGNARVWYETVLAFCDHHVLGRPWRRPELL